MSDELSDEAAAKFVKNVTLDPTEFPPIPLWLLVWREAVRRAEALIEQTFQDGVRKGCEISEVWTDREQVIETERRKAFEAGFWQLHQFYTTPSAFEAAREKAYRVYTESAKERK